MKLSKWRHYLSIVFISVDTCCKTVAFYHMRSVRSYLGEAQNPSFQVLYIGKGQCTQSLQNELSIKFRCVFEVLQGHDYTQVPIKETRTNNFFVGIFLSPTYLAVLPHFEYYPAF